MSLLKKLHELRKASQATTFGWYHDEHGHRAGFVYGGVLHHKNAGTSPVSATDAKLAALWRPVGSTDKWRVAAKCITDQRRPELNAILALSFASPLLALEGHEGATMAVHGQSGTQKTTALNVGMAVWTNYHKSREGTRATVNGIMQKMGNLVNLPVYWDEIKDEPAQRKLKDVLMEITGGQDKTHLKSDRTQGDKGSWQLLLCTSANISMVDYIERDSSGHDAVINRIFEYEIVTTPDTAPGKISDTVATRLVADLQYNYGGIGMEYSRFLADNVDAIYAEIGVLGAQIEADLQVREHERYWKAMVICLLKGAEYAVKMGVDIDLEELKTFLYNVFMAQRSRSLQANVVSGSVNNTEQTLNDYLKSRLTDNTLWCDKAYIPTGPGRPKAGGVMILHEPVAQSNKRQIQCRFNLQERQLLISKQDFLNWLHEDKRAAGLTGILRGLKTNFNMTEDRMVISGGTRWKVLQEKILMLAIDPGSDLDEMLHSYAGGLTAGPVTAPVTTGIIPAPTGAAPNVTTNQP
jgi:hypothetical protein